MSRSDFQGLRVEPNPAPESGKVTIKGEPGQTVFVVSPVGRKEAVKLNDKGEAEIPVPVEANEEFTVSDFDPKNPSSVAVSVVGSVK